MRGVCSAIVLDVCDSLGFDLRFWGETLMKKALDARRCGGVDWYS